MNQPFGVGRHRAGCPGNHFRA